MSVRILEVRNQGLKLEINGILDHRQSLGGRPMKRILRSSLDLEKRDRQYRTREMHLVYTEVVGSLLDILFIRARFLPFIGEFCRLAGDRVLFTGDLERTEACATGGALFHG